MRKSPRQVECCAALGPWSQGETAFSPSRLITRPGRKCNRNRNASGRKTIEGNITNSCGSGWAPSAANFVGAYFASLTLPKASAPDDNPDLSRKGAEAAAGRRCASCHGRYIRGNEGGGASCRPARGIRGQGA